MFGLEKVYWGDEIRLKDHEKALDYRCEKKQSQETAISALDVIRYCLSTLGATSYGEIYNLHEIIVDKNYEQSSKRTCQKLAIELARMFSAAGSTRFLFSKEKCFCSLFS